MHWVDDPVDSAVLADGFVRWVHQDDFEVLVCAVLVDPVRVEDSQVGASATDSLFGCGAQGSLVFELVDTLVSRLAWNYELVLCALRCTQNLCGQRLSSR